MLKTPHPPATAQEALSVLREEENKGPSFQEQPATPRNMFIPPHLSKRKVHYTPTGPAGPARRVL